MDKNKKKRQRRSQRKEKKEKRQNKKKADPTYEKHSIISRYIRTGIYMGKPKELEEERERTKLEEAERRSAEEENQPRRELHPKWLRCSILYLKETHTFIRRSNSRLINTLLPIKYLCNHGFFFSNHRFCSIYSNFFFFHVPVSFISTTF